MAALKESALQKAFLYQGNYYIRIIPAKSLMRSTTMYEVVCRGDIFAMRLHDQVFTVIPGTAEVEFFPIDLLGQLPEIDLDAL